MTNWQSPMQWVGRWFWRNKLFFFVKPDFLCSSGNMSQFWILEKTKQFFTSCSSIFPTAAVDLDRDIPLQALVQWKCIILLLIRNVCPHLKIDCIIVGALWIRAIPGAPNTEVLCHIQFIYQQQIIRQGSKEGFDPKNSSFMHLWISWWENRNSNPSIWVITVAPIISFW